MYAHRPEHVATEGAFAGLPVATCIRDVPLTPNLVLAPMEGVTDVTFRRLVRSIGGTGLTFTEFVAADGLRRGGKRELHMSAFDPDERPITIQVYGRVPEACAEAARVVQDLGATLVDLNMGCPSKKVCAHSGGSALMRDPALARDIVAAMRAAVDLPFTVKMRAGWDVDQENAPEIAWMCQEEGAEAVTVHWRTRTEKYGGTRRLGVIAEVVDRLSIPVFANGDIVDVPSAIGTLRATGCAGLMIGRGAIKNPWVFHQIRDVMQGREPLRTDADVKERTLLGYFEDIRGRFHSDKGALGRFKKISRYFTEGVGDGAALRRRIFHSQTPEEAIDVVHDHFDALRARGEAA